MLNFIQSLEAWKERRKQKSLKQREAIGSATVQAPEYVPTYDKKESRLGRSSKYQVTNFYSNGTPIRLVTRTAIGADTGVPIRQRTTQIECVTQ